MNANEKRQAVVDMYKTILGRNVYSQPRRDYCYKKYSDGKYYSDCSSSICYSYKQAGFGFGILNTVGMYQSKKLTEVPVVIKNGQIQNPEVLRIGDMLLFAGSDSSRAYSNFVGHTELVAIINGSSITLYGHGSGNPSKKDMKTYCKSRYNSKTSTKLGNKGLIKVVRYIQDDGTEGVPSDKPATIPTTDPVENTPVPSTTKKITGSSVYIRTGPGTSYTSKKIARYGETITVPDTSGWIAIKFDGKVGWISTKYYENGNCTGNTVNIRRGCGTAFDKMGIAKLGQAFDAVDYSGWCPVVIGTEVFFVSERYVK